jgi:hypothetical protein
MPSDRDAVRRLVEQLHADMQDNPYEAVLRAAQQEPIDGVPEDPVTDTASEARAEAEIALDIPSPTPWTAVGQNDNVPAPRRRRLVRALRGWARQDEDMDMS